MSQTPSPGEIYAARDSRGGHSQEVLASWGVPWPPPPGWLRTLNDRWRAEMTAKAAQQADDGDNNDL